MNSEQLLQEARIEAEKVYGNDMHSFGKQRDGYVTCYIANAKKQMSEAVAFHKWALTAILPHSCRSTEELYEIFKAQQKQE